MKRLLPLSFLLLFFSSLSAQTEKGNLMVGGNGTIGINSSNGNSAFSLLLNPTIGVFLKDNLAIGGAINLGFSSADNFTSTSYGIGPFLRGYVSELGPKSKLFLQGRVALQGQSLDLNGDNSSDIGFFAQAGVGLDIFLTEQVALEFLANYTYTDFSERFSNSSFGVNVGFQIFLAPNNN